ncbi:MAG: tetratricopeptide repeat protein [Gemmatimonadota bacterium]
MSESHGYQRFFAELRRRKVFQVAGVYGATSFVVPQVVDLLGQGLRLPDTLLTVVTVLTIVCFPIALVLAWAYERTPEGMQRTDMLTSGEVDELASLPAIRRWPSGIVAVVGVSMFAIGLWLALDRPADAGVENVPGGVPPTMQASSGGGLDPAAEVVANLARPTGTRSSAPTTSIAVLPFVNMSDDPADAYFSDGLAEEILNLLAQSPELKVTARTSSFALRDEQEDVRRIGEMLGVAHVLEGSVRRAGNVVRVTAQLIDTSDGFHEWSETFDRELTDVFAIQDEISGAIAEALEVEIAGGSSPTVLQRRTDDLEAYDYYLLGRHAWAGRTAEGIEAALEYFEQAIDADPEFGLAYSGLADALDAYAYFVSGDSREVVDRARAAALRAVELAPDLAEGYASLGLIEMEFDWDLQAAEQAFRRAMELNPGYTPIWNWSADVSILRGDAETAIERARRGIELDPMSQMVWWALGSALAVDGRLEEAMVATQRAADLAPGAGAINSTNLMLALLAEDWTKALGFAPYAGSAFRLPNPLRMVEFVEAVEHPTPESISAARALLYDIDRLGATTPFTLAEYHTAIGDFDTAVSLTEQAYEARNPEVIWAGVWIGFDPLRGDPRFDAVIEKLGVPNGGPGYHRSRR